MYETIKTTLIFIYVVCTTINLLASIEVIILDKTWLSMKEMYERDKKEPFIVYIPIFILWVVLLLTPILQFAFLRLAIYESNKKERLELGLDGFEE